jgi:uncharacterized protein (DUF885 family)
MMDGTLETLGEELWERWMADNPMMATILGDHRFDDRFDDPSLAAEDERIASRRAIAARARSVDPAGLDAEDRVSRDVLSFIADGEADELEMRAADFFVNPATGIQATLPTALSQVTLTEPDHAEALIERYAGIGAALGVLAERLGDGAARGRTTADLLVDATIAQVDAYLASDLATDPYLAIRPPSSFSDAESTAWRDRLSDAVVAHVRPGFSTYRDTLVDQVRPVARSVDRPGLSWLPGGEEVYRRLIRLHTSLDMSPDEVHRIGLEQVDRLAEEYRSLGPQVVGTDDVGEVFERLRATELHFETGAEVVAAAEAALGRAKARMGDWFGRLPLADCTVAEVGSGPTAFYYPPSGDGTRPGSFFVNTSDPRTWGRYEIMATAFHEGIPGHHLQLAISQELAGVPAYRRYAPIAAYAEGWGLYAERLADEMGLYESPLERLGMCSADSMRATRLVVDTGLHAHGWSRQRAIDYMAANTPMQPGLIANEVDRYIGWPGQAVSYMVGRLEIQRLRAEAEAGLGHRFDIKGFHDVVLGSGLVPLCTLAWMIETWVEASR